MKQELSTEELARNWSLSFSDLDFLNAKPKVTRYVLAVQLKYFTANGFVFFGKSGEIATNRLEDQEVSVQHYICFKHPWFM